MHKCHGNWELIPELSFYEQGEPPLSCKYVISVDGLEVAFDLSWVQVDGQAMNIAFGGTADSIPRKVENPEGVEVSYTLVSDDVLESRMFVNGAEMAYAKRVVSPDGKLMSVLQVNTDAQGKKLRITQVYQRH